MRKRILTCLLIRSPKLFLLRNIMKGRRPVSSLISNIRTLNAIFNIASNKLDLIKSVPYIDIFVNNDHGTIENARLVQLVRSER
jgi:hypothetical protein